MQRAAVRVSQAPGGTSTLDLTDGSATAATQRPAEELQGVLNAVHLVRRERRPPGGRSTMGSLLQGPAARQSSWSITDSVAGAVPVRRPTHSTLELTEEDVHILKTQESEALFGPQDASRSLCSDFGMLIHLLASRHGVLQLGTDGLHTALELLCPLEVSTMRTLVDAVRCQCQALDQAALSQVVRQHGLFDHLRGVHDLCLWSHTSDFLSTLSRTVVQVAFDSRLRGECGPRTMARKSPWTSETVREGVRMASQGVRNATAPLLLFLRIEGTDICASAPTEPPAMLHSTLTAFGTAGLSQLTIAYDAPWPVAAFITPTHMQDIALATRRLLELGQLSALFGLTWTTVRNMQRHTTSAAVSAIKSTAVSNKITTKQLHMKLNCALLQAQTAVRAFNTYTAHTLQAQQALLQQQLLHGLHDGCAGVQRAVSEHAISLPILLFCNVLSRENSDATTGQERFMQSLVLLLQEVRCLLASIYRLSLPDELLEEQEQVQQALQHHMWAFETHLRDLTRAARAISDADMQSRAAQLLANFDIHI